MTFRQFPGSPRQKISHFAQGNPSPKANCADNDCSARREIGQSRTISGPGSQKRARCPSGPNAPTDYQTSGLKRGCPTSAGNDWPRVGMSVPIRVPAGQSRAPAVAEVFPAGLPRPSASRKPRALPSQCGLIPPNFCPRRWGSLQSGTTIGKGQDGVCPEGLRSIEEAHTR